LVLGRINRRERGGGREGRKEGGREGGRQGGTYPGADVVRVLVTIHIPSIGALHLRGREGGGGGGREERKTGMSPASCDFNLCKKVPCRHFIKI